MENWGKEMRFDGERSGVDGESGAPERIEAFEREEVGEAVGVILRRRERRRAPSGVGGNGGRRR